MGASKSSDVTLCKSMTFISSLDKYLKYNFDLELRCMIDLNNKI